MFLHGCECGLGATMAANPVCWDGQPQLTRYRTTCPPQPIIAPTPAPAPVPVSAPAPLPAPEPTMSVPVQAPPATVKVERETFVPTVSATKANDTGYELIQTMASGGSAPPPQAQPDIVELAPPDDAPLWPWIVLGALLLSQ